MERGVEMFTWKIREKRMVRGSECCFSAGAVGGYKIGNIKPAIHSG
jgi:hypothetical protein